MYQVSDLVWFDQVQIIHVPELGLVHLWLDRSVTCYNAACLWYLFIYYHSYSCMWWLQCVCWWQILQLMTWST